jgi:outer membrane lipoprotein-sorting protein
MKTNTWTYPGFVLLLAAVTRAETMDEVEKKLMEAHAKLQSYTARLKHVEHVPLTGTDFMASDVDGTIEWKRKGDAILYRLEITGTSTQKFGANEQKSEQTSTLVSDGKLFYTFAEQMGQKRFIKQKTDTSINGDIRSVLETVQADNNFKLAADEKVDGAECYVIEVTPKTPPSDDNPIHKTLIFFRKDFGLNVRVVSRNKAGKDVFDNTFLNLKTNVSIDASRFVLHAPSDVEITDLTGIEDTPKAPTTDPKPQSP